MCGDFTNEPAITKLNYIMVELALAPEGEKAISRRRDIPVSPEDFTDLLKLVNDGIINSSMGNRYLRNVQKPGKSPRRL